MAFVLSRSARSRQRLGRGAPTLLLVSLTLVGINLALSACGTTLSLESVHELPEVEHPTEATFEIPKDEVWEAVLDVLTAQRIGIELAEPGLGRITTAWKEAPSLIYRSRRLGNRSEESSVPLPARFRLAVTVVEEHSGETRVVVAAEEETNFRILTGTDPASGRSYYQDQWRPTLSRTTREHEFLVALREELERR